MKAVSVVADVKGGTGGGGTYHYMAKCFPINPQRVKFLKSVREREKKTMQLNSVNSHLLFHQKR